MISAFPTSNATAINNAAGAYNDTLLYSGGGAAVT